MAPKQSEAASAGSTTVENLTGKADNYVPTFSGKQSEYREFRKRCDIYAAKMRLAKRQSETIFNHSDVVDWQGMGLHRGPCSGAISRVFGV